MRAPLLLAGSVVLTTGLLLACGGAAPSGDDPAASPPPAPTGPRAVRKSGRMANGRITWTYQGRFGPDAQAKLVVYEGDGPEGTSALVLAGKETGSVEHLGPASLFEVDGLVAADFDNDGADEVLLVASWVTGMGPQGARPFQQNLVLEWDGAKAWTHQIAAWEDLRGVDAVLERLAAP